MSSGQAYQFGDLMPDRTKDQYRKGMILLPDFLNGGNLINLKIISGSIYFLNINLYF